MATLNFQPYKANFVPRPIEAIGNMMQRFDENNQKLASTYQGLNQALSSFQVEEGDTPIIQGAREELETSMDKAVGAQDYNYMQGHLNNAVNSFMKNDSLKASVNRSAEYRAKRKQVEEMYNSGDIDREFFVARYNQPYIPTQADPETGTFNPHYDEFKMPIRKFDIKGHLSSLLSSMQSDMTSGEPQIKYYTAGELAKARGLDVSEYTAEQLKEETPYIKYMQMGGHEYRSPDKIRKALTQELLANPDAQAYINGLAEIRTERGEPTNAAAIVDSFVDPYVTAGAFSRDRSRYTGGSNIHTIAQALNKGQTGTGVFTAVVNGGEGKPKHQEEAERAGSISRAGKVLNSAIDALNIVQRYAGRQEFGPLVTPGNIYRTEAGKKVANTEYASLINNIALDSYRELGLDKPTEYDDLTSAQRLQFEDIYKEKLPEYYDTDIKNQIYIKPADTKEADEMLNGILGTKNIAAGLYIGRNGKLENTLPDRDYYVNGEVLDATELTKLLEKEFGKKGSRNRIIPHFIGTNHATTIPYYTNNYDFTTGHAFKIGDLEIIAAGSQGMNPYFSIVDKISADMVSGINQDVVQGPPGADYLDTDYRKVGYDENGYPKYVVTNSNKLVPPIEISGNSQQIRKALKDYADAVQIVKKRQDVSNNSARLQFGDEDDTYTQPYDNDYSN